VFICLPGARAACPRRRDEGVLPSLPGAWVTPRVNSYPSAGLRSPRNSGCRAHLSGWVSGNPAFPASVPEGGPGAGWGVRDNPGCPIPRPRTGQEEEQEPWARFGIGRSSLTVAPHLHSSTPLPNRSVELWRCRAVELKAGLPGSFEPCLRHGSRQSGGEVCGGSWPLHSHPWVPVSRRTVTCV